MGLFSGRSSSTLATRGSNLPDVLADALGARRRRGGLSSVGWSDSQAIPAALDAVRLRHDLVSTLPVQTFRRRTDGRPEPIDNPEVLEQPAAEFDIIDWLAASQKSLDLRGKAVGIIVDRDRLGYATQIELQHPDKCWPRLDGSGIAYWRINGQRVETHEVWHERSHPEPGSVLGLSPIAAAARALGIALAAEKFGGDFFGDGAHPTAMLTNSRAGEIDQSAAAVVKARFLAALDGGREPVVLGSGWEYKALQIAPNESQFLETQKFGVNQVARIFNVPSELIGGGADGTSLTYANREQRALDFLAYRFNPTVRRRERALTRLTPRGQFVKLNRAGLLAVDLLTRYKSYELGLRNGVLAPEEPRDLEDRLPLTDAQVAVLKEWGLLGKTSTPAAAPDGDADPSKEAS